MYTHIAGMWFDDRRPMRSHSTLLVTEWFGTGIGHCLLCATIICLVRLARTPTFTHALMLYATYTSTCAVAMLRILPPQGVSQSVHPQIQLCVLLAVLPRALYIPAAIFACFTSPGIFQIVGLVYIAHKAIECARRPKSNEAPV